MTRRPEMAVWLPCLVAVVVLLCVASQTDAASPLPAYTFYSGIVNVEVKRTVNIKSNIEDVKTEFSVENTGSEAASFYIFALPQKKAASLSYITASVEDKEVRGVIQAQLTGVKKSEGVAYYKVPLVPALKAGATSTVVVQQFFAHTLVPLPEEITQDEDQFVVYEDNVYTFSPYSSKQQSLTVLLASEKVESRTKKRPSKHSKDTLEYGPFENVAAFSEQDLRVHYLNNSPFITFTDMVKEIEVSHWGNVAVEEQYWLKHTGAALKGSFSRFDYQQRPRIPSARSSFRTLTALLPVAATDTYYTDGIGNISTSAVRRLRDGSGQQLELDPRFPMFGGWKTDFRIGYNVPAHTALSRSKSDPDTFVLTVPFSTAFNDAVVDKLTLRVILPEGATNIRYVAPFPIEQEGKELRMTYLDTTGRPVLVLEKSNLMKNHNVNFQVVYNFSAPTMLREPLLLSALVFAFFVLSMFSVRLDLSISGKATSGALELWVKALRHLKDADVAGANPWLDQLLVQLKQSVSDNAGLARIAKDIAAVRTSAADKANRSAFEQKVREIETQLADLASE